MITWVDRRLVSCQLISGWNGCTWARVRLTTTLSKTSIGMISTLKAPRPFWMRCCWQSQDCPKLPQTRGDTPGSWFNIKMSSYLYTKSHCGDKTVLRSSYLNNGISYTGKMTSFYWISPLVWSRITQPCKGLNICRSSDSKGSRTFF